MGLELVPGSGIGAGFSQGVSTRREGVGEDGNTDVQTKWVRFAKSIYFFFFVVGRNENFEGNKNISAGEDIMVPLCVL